MVTGSIFVPRGADGIGMKYEAGPGIIAA